MGEALQQRVLELESDLREERRTRIKLERMLKSAQADRNTLGDDLKIEKKSAEKKDAEVKTAQLDKNKLLQTVDQMNRKLEAAASELVRLRSEIKLKDKICSNMEPHPPPQPPRRKAKTRSAPSHAMGVLESEKGAAEMVEELEALLGIAEHERSKAEKVANAERKKRQSGRREMAELSTAATMSCDQGRWALQWVRQGVTAVDMWLGGLRVKDTNSGVWSQGLASTRATIQYMKKVLASSADALDELQVNVDRARDFCGQPVTSGAAPLRPKVTAPDGSEESMNELIEQAQQMLEAREHQKQNAVPALKLPSSTPRGGHASCKSSYRTVDTDYEESTSSRTVPPGQGGSYRSKEARGSGAEQREHKPKRSNMLPPPVAESRYAGPAGRNGRGVKDPMDRGGQTDSYRKEHLDNQDRPPEQAGSNTKQQDGYASRPSKGSILDDQEEHLNISNRPNADRTARSCGGGYADQYRKRMNAHQRSVRS